jgi:hypothetical protein
MNFGAGHAALATVGERELAALGQWVGVQLDNLIIARELVIVVLVRREIGVIQLSRILDEKRKRRNSVCEWFL